MTPALRKLPTTLVLDFHDSYTRNLLQLVAQQVDHNWDVTDWQLRTVVINVDSLSWNSFVSDILPRIDCIVLGPGPGTPHSDEDFCWAKRLITEYGAKVPILGICLGCQGLATAFGGTVGKAATPVHGQVSKIHHSHNPIFEGIPDTFAAVQFNSLVVDLASVPNELEIIATSDRGEVMGLAAVGKPLWGVQFHPESICSTYGAKILSNFFRLSLDHLHQSANSPTPNLPSFILDFSSSYQAPLDLGNGLTETEEAGSLAERRTIELGTDLDITPQRVFEQLIKGKGALGEVWLESARPTGVPQFSHLLNPVATLSYFTSKHSITSRISQQPDTPTSIALPPSLSVFDYLSSIQARLQSQISHQACPLASVPVGFVGYISYEMKTVTMPPSRPTTSRHVKEAGEAEDAGAEFAFANKVLSYAHDSGKWFATALVRTGHPEDDLHCVMEEEWTRWTSDLRDYFSTSDQRPPFSAICPAPLPACFVPDQSRDSYLSSIESARSSITLGNAYELCLTTQFRATLEADSPLVNDPYPLYLSLRATNPAPYSAYYNLPKSNLTIISSSPERFLRSTKTGKVSMKPIKGTVRRCREDPEEDERRKAVLEADEKERAENLMIVDLIRNDLLGFCQAESVEVEGLMKIETYETVHQMVTTVVGQLKRGVTPFDAVSQAFPPGSMTGAPKLRSLQLLDELEHRRSRGIYSGVFGYVGTDGASDWSVVIRTLVKRRRELRLGAGGAITHLSDPIKEWEEVLTKIDAVLRTKQP